MVEHLLPKQKVAGSRPVCRSIIFKDEDMKNINYDILKMLHSKLDNVWRLENYYVADAEKAKCHSVPALKQILEEEKKQSKRIKW